MRLYHERFEARGWTCIQPTDAEMASHVSAAIALVKANRVAEAYAPLAEIATALAARGAVVVIPDYGLSPAFTYPVFVRDSALAVKWALDNAAQLGADPKQVYVMGHSSGGYNAAMVALDDRWLAEVGASPRQLAGWIGLAGPTASGKTAVALALAERWPLEVVSVDSAL
eukprot:gene50378-68490_t